MPLAVSPYTGPNPQNLKTFQPGGAGTDLYEGIVLCDSAGNIIDTAAAAPAGSERGLITRNIPSGTQDVARKDVQLPNQTVDMTVLNAAATFDVSDTEVIGLATSGGYTGSLRMECSMDGTTWSQVSILYPMGGRFTVLTSGALGRVSVAGYRYFRTRVSTVATGTATVMVRESSGSPITIIAEPVPSLKGSQASHAIQTQQWKDAGRARYSFGAENIAGSTAEGALISFVSMRDFTAAAAATTLAVPSGETLVLTGYSLGIRNTTTATATGWARVRLRAVASGGTLANTSPIQWQAQVGWPVGTATLENNGHISGSFPDGMMFPGGSVIGFNLISSNTNMNVSLYLFGYSY